MSLLALIKKIFLFAIFIILSSALYAAEDKTVDNSNDAATKVAVVDVAKLLEESPRAKNLGGEISKKYLPEKQALEKERKQLEKLEKQLDQEDEQLSREESLKRSRDYRERRRQYTRAYEAFRDQLNSAKQEALEIVKQEVFAAIDAVRAEKHIDIVIENYISADKKVDITPAVLQYLEANYQKSQQNALDPSEEEK